MINVVVVGGGGGHAAARKREGDPALGTGKVFGLDLIAHLRDTGRERE